MAWYDQLFTDLKAYAAAVATDVKAILPRLIPAGGSDGQALVKNGSANYATRWATLAGGSSKTVLYESVASYSAMRALNAPTALTIVKVDYDTKASPPNATYHLWPSGARQLISATTDVAPTDYGQTGTVIDDGGGTFQNSTSVNSAKVFDCNPNTYYDAANSGSGKYVGRDLGSQVTLTKISILPRQDSQYFGTINSGQVQYSTNGTDWTTIYTISGVTSSNYTQYINIPFQPITARYWRLYWPGGSSFGNVAEINLLFVN